MADERAWAALLRGINVGGRHRVPMAELRALLAEHGCTDVRTLIQSGNALFRAPGDAEALSARLGAAIEARFGFPVPTIVLDPAVFADARAMHPFLDGEGAPATLHVGFLAAEPEAARVAALDPDRSPGDRFAVVGAASADACHRDAVAMPFAPPG